MADRIRLLPFGAGPLAPPELAAELKGVAAQLLDCQLALSAGRDGDTSPATGRAHTFGGAAELAELGRELQALEPRDQGDWREAMTGLRDYLVAWSFYAVEQLDTADYPNVAHALGVIQSALFVYAQLQGVELEPGR